MKYIISALALASLLPVVAFAQSGVDDGYITSLIANVESIIGALLPIVVSIAVLLFFWGLALFILNSGDEEARTRGKNIMIWGIIALFVIVAVWGLVALLASVLGVGTGGAAAVPGVQTDVDDDNVFFQQGGSSPNGGANLPTTPPPLENA